MPPPALDALAPPPAPPDAPAPPPRGARQRCLPLRVYLCPAPCCIPTPFVMPGLLENEGKFAWSESHALFAVVVLLFGAALLGFSLWYWFGASNGVDFWLTFST